MNDTNFVKIRKREASASQAFVKVGQSFFKKHKSENYTYVVANLKELFVAIIDSNNQNSFPF